MTLLISGPGGRYPAPADWVAVIQYMVNEYQNGSGQSLDIVFSRPPDHYNFRRFQVALVGLPEEENIEIQVDVTNNVSKLSRDAAYIENELCVKRGPRSASELPRCLISRRVAMDPKLSSCGQDTVITIAQFPRLIRVFVWRLVVVPLLLRSGLFVLNNTIRPSIKLFAVPLPTHFKPP